MVWYLINSYLNAVPLWVWLVLCGISAAVVFYFLSPIIIPIWTLMPKWLKITLGALGAVLAAFIGGKHAGAKNERDLQKERDARADQTGREVRNEIEKLSPADRDKRLDRWLRD